MIAAQTRVGRSGFRRSDIAQEAAGLVMIAVALVYLTLFVPRGWVPHDEGMLGQSAERVLRGAVPHVDYQEPYTGGLAWLYAAVFRVAGVDLLHLRWLLFAGAVVAQVATYAILRRYLRPIPAALAAWVALTWSFPNFFAGLPSWWLLICALCCVWAFIRYVETGVLRYAALAGLAAGCAVAVKQTGVYLLVALVMSLLYDGGTEDGPSPVDRAGPVIRVSVAIAASAVALAILSSRPAPAELLYLLLPIVACSLTLATAKRSFLVRSGLPAIAAAVAAASVPLVALVAPYVMRQQLGALIEGLVILPQQRLRFASMDMPSAYLILSGLPVLALVMPFSRSIELAAFRSRAIGTAMWGLAVALAAASLRDERSYQIVWQSSRAFAALLPVAIAWLLISRHIVRPSDRRVLFSIAAMLSWGSLVQFPFSAPIYFCYVAPLAVLAGVATAALSLSITRPAIVAWSALLIVFAVSAMNRGYIYNLGRFHVPQRLEAPLHLPKATLTVSEEEAQLYQRVVRLVTTHLGEGSLVAGPDCPEIHFLAGRVNASGALFDFFQLNGREPQDVRDTAGASVIVLNHRPSFSPFPGWGFTPQVRSAFPEGEMIGHFEVRWRR
jgi:hypothetical protein